MQALAAAAMALPLLWHHYNARTYIASMQQRPRSAQVFTLESSSSAYFVSHGSPRHVLTLSQPRDPARVAR